MGGWGVWGDRVSEVGGVGVGVGRGGGGWKFIEWDCLASRYGGISLPILPHRQSTLRHR